jgi:glycosyltransferase involved in cell wall biosynthesis
MTSIQNQIYDNIEIIFVDDFSNDGSIELIQNYMRKDKRIILIKHQKNEGTLITRNDGVLKARGEYIIFVDPDDMILYNSLQNLYEITIKYKDIDVIQFRAYKKWEKIYPWTRGYTSFDTVVEQPELSSIMFYVNGKLNQINYFIWGKLIKRKIFLETIEKLGDYYRNQYMTLYEDVAMLFVLLSIAKNYVYVNIYGYLYYSNKISVFENRFKYRRANRTIRDCFLLSEILFDFSKNTKYDKLMALFTLNRIYWMYYHVCTFITSGFEFIYRVLNKFIKCQFLSLGNKYLVFKLKKLIEDTQKKLRNFTKNEIISI